MAMQIWRRVVRAMLELCVDGAGHRSQPAVAVSLSRAARHSTSQTTIQMISQRNSGSVMAVVCK